MLRLFIAFLVPEDIKNSIAELVAETQKIPGLPEEIRFVPEENWHFTLVFLGYQPEGKLPAIEDAVKSCKPSEAVRIEFEKLIYGPSGGLPRMVWLNTTKETLAALGRIKNELEKELMENGVKWRRESRPYRPHLTLAKFRPRPAKNLPLIERDVNLGYSTGEINLMKSTLKRTGAEYEKIL